MRFVFAHTFEANWEIEADTYEDAERIAFEKMGRCKVVDKETGKEVEDFVEQEPWELEWERGKNS